MKLLIEIKMDNAAFRDDDSDAENSELHGAARAREVARILRAEAASLEDGSLDVGDESPLLDANGNKVGMLRVTDD